MGEMNVHSLIWNLHCQKKKIAKPFEELIEKFGLLINDKPKQTTSPASQGVFIIDLALSITELGLWTLWEIPERCLLLFDYEFILLW